MIDLERAFLEFSPEAFIEKAIGNVLQRVEERGAKGVVLGASGGIDSLVCALLCVKARERGEKWPVAGLQLNDSRIKGESYNAPVYRSMGVNLLEKDITNEAIQREREFFAFPRMLISFMMKLVLRSTPVQIKRNIILAVKGGTAPRWITCHYHLLTLLHRIRIHKLREFASRYRYLAVVCSNLTEADLGYFVEEGIDDPSMGDHAPVSQCYKSQVFRVAKCLGLPRRVLEQRPSPGFGGVYDDEIIGPYEWVDKVLLGIKMGLSDREITESIITEAGKIRSATCKEKLHGLGYVRFVRRLMQLSKDKK